MIEAIERQEIFGILTKTQYEILKMMGEYKTNAEIAKERSIERTTVESHVNKILDAFFPVGKDSRSRKDRYARYEAVSRACKLCLLEKEKVIKALIERFG